MKHALNPSHPLTKALLLHCLQAVDLKAVDRDRGFTLLEAMVAMIIITIILAFIAGPIVMTAGTRVKNQSTEQSLSLAQSYVEQARIALIQVSSWTEHDLNPAPTDASGAAIATGIDGIPYGADSTLGAENTTPITEVDAPTEICDPDGLLGTASACTAYTQMRAVDYDDDGEVDFYVQTFRLNDIDDNDTSTTDEIMGFDIGVRVYSDLAANTLSDGNTLDKAPMSSNMTSSLLSATQPITAYYTSLYRSENPQALTTFNLCEVPNVEGSDTSDGGVAVEAVITGADLTPSGTQLTPSGGEAEVVVAGSQSPAGNTKVACGSTISYEFYDTP